MENSKIWKWDRNNDLRDVDDNAIIEGAQLDFDHKALIASAPQLLDESVSADQGYDWFREQLNNFRLYHGAWDMDESEAWANSLIAHINSRQIGTKAVIAKAEGK